MAPRDIDPGMLYGEAVVEAISRSSLLVLLFSASANSSYHVTSEVERAVTRRIPVLVCRTEDVLPTGSLELFVSSSHWLDVFGGPPAQHLHRLAEAAAKLLRRAHAVGPIGRPDPAAAGRLPDVSLLKVLC
jgi:hypothetical protein